MRSLLFSIGLISLSASMVATARAELIDFEGLGVVKNEFDFMLDSPLVIGSATFTGGELLLNDEGLVDATTVYATAFGSPYTDPLTISFSAPVSEFSVQVTNEVGDDYTVADNLGGSQTSSLGFNVTGLLSLPDSGISSVAIGSANGSNFEFAIDNVQFTPVTSVVPEPTGILPLVSALGITMLLARLAGPKG